MSSKCEYIPRPAALLTAEEKASKANGGNLVVDPECGFMYRCAWSPRYASIKTVWVHHLDAASVSAEHVGVTSAESGEEEEEDKEDRELERRLRMARDNARALSVATRRRASAPPAPGVAAAVATSHKTHKTSAAADYVYRLGRGRRSGVRHAPAVQALSRSTDRS